MGQTENSDEKHKIPLPAVFLVFLPFAFVLMMMFYAKIAMINPKAPSSTCARTEGGQQILSKRLAGTLELTSGLYVIKDKHNRLTLLAKCGRNSCLGPFQELSVKPLHQQILVSFCGNELMFVAFTDGDTVYPPSKPERR
jgi:hypothetical protein